MSQSITITRTTTSSNASYIVLNTGYLKTFPGGLKLVEFILGVICVAILSIDSYYKSGIWQFFYLMAVCFMVGTFILLLSCLISLGTGGIISKTIYVSFYLTFENHLLKKLHFSGGSVSWICWSTTFNIICDVHVACE